MSHTSPSESGFTLIELLLVIALIPLVVGSFIFTLYEVSNSSSHKAFQLDMDDDSRQAMHSIEQDVRTATAFHSEIPASFTDAYGPDNTGSDWSFAGSSSDLRVLLLTKVATTSISGNGNRTPVYIDSPTYNCTTELLLNPPLLYMVVYFVRDRTLYRRILTDTNSPTCGETMTQKQSCPGDLSDSWDASCLARDEVRAHNVSSFKIDYYSQRQTTPASAVYTDPLPADMTMLDDAEITLGLAGDTGYRASQNSIQTLRIARLNKL